MNATNPSAGTVSTIPEAIAAMRDLGGTLPSSDGVAAFNSMYLQVTEAVGSRLDAGMFVDPVFMDRLDVNFANLYLGAYERYSAGSGQPVCASWRTLFDRRYDDRVRPLQFALAGMNAHINHDLPLAVTMTAAELNRPPTTAGVHEDFVAVNDILAEADDAVRAGLQGAVMSTVDEVCGPFDDAVGAWGIRRARDAAWRQATQLWDVRDDPPHYERFMSTLDRLVALASACLLTPLSDGGDRAHRLLMPAFDALDSFGDRVSKVLWGDGVVDGEDDGILGAFLWAARSRADEPEEPADDDESFMERVADSVLSRLRDVQRAI